MVQIKKVLSILKYTDVSLKIQGLQYIRCLVYMIIYSVSSMIFPGVLSLIIDRGISTKNINNTIIYTVLFFLTGVTIVIFQYLQRMGFSKLSQKLITDMKNKIVEKLLKTNLEFWNKHKIGDIYTIVESDIPKLESLLSTLISDALVNFLVIIGTLGLLCYINPLIGSVLFIAACLFAFFQKEIGKEIKNKMTEMRKQIGKQASFTNEILNYVVNIQLTNLSTGIYQNYEDNNKKIVGKQISQIRTLSISKSIGMIYNITSMLFVIIIGSVRTYNGSLTVGLFFSLILYAQNLYSPVVGLSNIYVTIKNIIPLVDKIYEVFVSSDVISSGQLCPNKNIKGNMRFNHVFYSYDGNESYQIKDLSFEVKTGEIIGIVGNNGCGKTTIIKLLSLLCLPQKGCIEIDDIQITEYNIDFLRTQVGYMLQNLYLPSGVLKNALNYELGKEKLKQLIVDFELDIQAFPEGLESIIDENHSNLSGGECQKISLIRMFMEDKSLYILDEPTAAIDMHCEEKICSSIKKYLHGKTAIIITHRPEILKICNEILYL